MPDVEPKSIIGSAMIAACLDLPIEKSLGFAWIVPYKKGDQKLAQFQIGFRGYIQLAQRTGYYAGMNACPVNAEAFKGRDNLGEPIIDWDLLDETKPAVGYFFGFKMVNGFTKGTYWTKAKVEAHARKYSQAFRSSYDSPWKSHFDKMALKTVISNELSDWGIMSVQFQLARKADQGVTKDIDAEVEYIDAEAPPALAETNRPEPTPHQQATQTATSQVKQPEKEKEEDNVPMTGSTPLAAKPENTVETAVKAPEATQTPPEASKVPNLQENNGPVAVESTVASEPTPAGTPSEPDPALAPKAGESDEVASIKLLAAKAGVTWGQVKGYLVEKKLMRPEQAHLSELASQKLTAINKNFPRWIGDIKALPR